MVAAAGLAQVRLPQPNKKPVAKKDFESWVPNTVGPWTFLTASGVVLPPKDALSDRLYDNLVSRVYQADNLPTVALAIAYNNAQDGVVQLHRPEVCYPAGGYALTPTRPVEVQTSIGTVPANFFTAKGYDRTEQVLYWTRLGKEFPRAWSAQRLSVMRANLEGVIPDGLLMRVSVLTGDEANALGYLQQFIGAFEAAAARPLRKIMLG